MSSLFQKQTLDRNRRYLTIARQADGGIVVSPGGVFSRSFHLTEDELEPYLAWEARHHKKQMRIAWLVGIVAILIVLLLTVRYPGYGGVFIIGIGVWVSANNKWAVRSFGARFPDSPRARDGDKWRRFANLMLAGLPWWLCIVGAVLFWWRGWKDLEGLVTPMSGYSALGIFRDVLYGGGSVIVGTFFGFLTFEHFQFRRQHGRAPSMDDIAPPL